jgi:hypothetical protein
MNALDEFNGCNGTRDGQLHVSYLHSKGTTPLRIRIGPSSQRFNYTSYYTALATRVKMRSRFLGEKEYRSILSFGSIVEAEQWRRLSRYPVGQMVIRRFGSQVSSFVTCILETVFSPTASLALQAVYRITPVNCRSSSCRASFERGGYTAPRPESSFVAFREHGSRHYLHDGPSFDWHFPCHRLSAVALRVKLGVSRLCLGCQLGHERLCGREFPSSSLNEFQKAHTRLFHFRSVYRRSHA